MPLNCMCGTAPKLGASENSWGCSNRDCWIVGPDNDPKGTKWDALMRPHQNPSAAKGATVRVRAKVWLDREGKWNLAGAQWWEKSDWTDSHGGRKPIAYITANIPLPQPSEIAGEVE